MVANAGESIPDTWTAGSSVRNAAGELRSEIARLDFSLLRQSGGLL